MTVKTLLAQFCKQHAGPISGYVLLLFLGTAISLVGITKITAKMYKSVSGNDRQTAFSMLIALLILTVALTATNWSIDYIENKLMPRFRQFVITKTNSEVINANETNMQVGTNALRFRAYVSATTNATTTIFNAVVKQYVPNIVMAVVLIGFLLHLSPSYGIVFLVGGAIIAGLFALNRKNMLQNSKLVETKMRFADMFTFDIFKNMETVVSKGQIGPEKAAIAARLEEAATAQIFANQKFDNILYVLNGLLAAMIFVTMGLAINKLQRGGDDEKTIYAVLTALTLLAQLKNKMTALNNTNLSMMQSFGRYAANHLKDVAEFKPPPAGRFRVCADDRWCATTLEFRDVHFIYPRTTRPILSGFSWRIGPRGVYCLRAPSGSGKSTLAKLVVREFEPTRGSIVINGRDIRKLDINNLRSSVELINQDQGFLERSIREVLCFGQKDECQTAERTQQMWESMKEMFEGLSLDDSVGANGNKLSTGMKAMLRFNAALLSDASVIICDEPTNGLSPEYKQRVLKTITEMGINKTVLLITHDGETVSIAQEVKELLPQHSR